jgi:hypothetical protein
MKIQVIQDTPKTIIEINIYGEAFKVDKFLIVSPYQIILKLNGDIQYTLRGFNDEFLEEVNEAIKSWAYKYGEVAK